MDSERMPIGDLAARAGLPVKTVRFYSDEGLLPPAGRTAAGYRLYAGDDLVRLETIRALRDAGVDLATIRDIFARRTTLVDALEVRLGAVEAHIVSLRRVAAALRAALRTEPTEDDLRRLHAVTRLSNDERRTVIEGFFAKVTEDVEADAGWVEAMIDASVPELPDDPAPEQLDAWIELSEMMSDQSFVETMRTSAEETSTTDYDSPASIEASVAALSAARELIDAAVEPESDAGAPIAEEFVVANARANRVRPDASYRSELRAGMRSLDPRTTQYWELVAIVNGDAEIARSMQEWSWLRRAILHHVR